MTPRLTRAEYERDKGEANHRSLIDLVEAGAQVGVLGYQGQVAVAWCAIAPREDYSSLARSRILKPVDALPVWSIVCLFVDREHRRTGVSTAMIRGAAEHAFRSGANIVEGYPVEPKTAAMPPVFAYTGIAAAYRKAGFSEVARRSETRPIMRLQRGSLPSGDTPTRRRR